jgi:ketosteroid isomerase-like protein
MSDRMSQNEQRVRAYGALDVPFAHVWMVRDGYPQRMHAFTDTAVLARALGR